MGGSIRFFMLMGRKNHKGTLLDKILLTGVMPIAHLLGFIHYIIERFSKK